VVQAPLEEDRRVESAGVVEQDPVEVAGQGPVAVLGPEVPKELHRENG